MESAVLEFWRHYLDSLPPDLDQEPKPSGVFSFGDSKKLGDELATLVRQGIKTATCSALMGYEKDQIPLPQKGDLSIVLDMNKINTSLAVALLMSVISAIAVELSFQTSTAQLKQKTTRHEPFVIQRLYPAARVKSDCEEAIQMAAQRDEAALDKMIQQDRVTFFAVGTRVYPVKSTDMGTWWLVREKGSTGKWWISVRAFSQD